MLKYFYVDEIFREEELIEQIEMEIDDAGMDNDFDDGGR